MVTWVHEYLKLVKAEHYWLNDKGLLHRENDEPAVIRKNGTKEWWFNGQHHRENDLPAIMHSLGPNIWMMHGKRHRIGGPAVQGPDGQQWWELGKLHRIGGPAIDMGDYQVYSRRGRFHRVDGPARTKGSKIEWWVDGRRLTHEELKTWKYLLTCDPGELLLYVSEPLYAPILEIRLINEITR